MELARDLGSADVWADSLERSLARRGRPRRASLELGRLSPERDLSNADTVNESVVYWRTRRAASASSTFTLPAVGGASVLALLAATTLPSLAGSAKPTTGKGAQHRSGATASGARSAPAAHTVVHRAVSAKPAFTAPATAAQANSAPAAPPRPVVYGKVTHGDLRDAQRLLGVPIDDVLGPKTGAAIRAFQQSHGLTVDGDIGPATWDALKAAEHAQAVAATTLASAASVAAPAVHEASAMQPATSTPDPSGVIAVQQQLGIPADGTFGTETTDAVSAFQTAHGLPADGVVGPATRAALGLGDGPTLQAATTGGTTSPAATDAATTPAATTPAATTDAVTTDAVTTDAVTTDASATTDAASSTTTSSTPVTSTAATTTTAGPSASVSAALSAMVTAGDNIATLPYIWGGGHGSWVSPGYDCSGSVSYVLHAAGLLSVPEDSSALESYGAAGPGQYVTIYANAGHAWMTIDGRRYDTVSLAEDGSRWGTTPGDPSGFIVRHPVGF
jgi:peptidoglycan hydrolase-like protein with peptidoglycan-binding domain